MTQHRCFCGRQFRACVLVCTGLGRVGGGGGAAQILNSVLTGAAFVHILRDRQCQSVNSQFHGKLPSHMPIHGCVGSSVLINLKLASSRVHNFAEHLRTRPSFFPAGVILCVVWSPVDGIIASAAADRTIRIWQSKTGQCLKTLRGHVGIVLSCCFSSDGETLVSNEESVYLALCRPLHA